MSQKLRIGIIGATGIVGQELAKSILQKFPHCTLSLFVTRPSKISQVEINGQKIFLQILEEKFFTDLDIAIFSVKEALAHQWIPIALRYTCKIIDLSSAYRLNKDVPLVCTPVINCKIIKNASLIACPNCTVSLITKVLFPLQQQFGILGFSACTYQSISGAGRRSLLEWKRQLSEIVKKKGDFVFNDIKNFANNCIPQIGPIDNTGYSSEEQSIEQETKKILNNPNLKISATCVRVSCERGHGISLTVQLQKKFSLDEIKKTLLQQLNIRCDTKTTPAECAYDENIYCSRIRKDTFTENALSLWITGDQITAGTIPNIISIIKIMATRQNAQNC